MTPATAEALFPWMNAGLIFSLLLGAAFTVGIFATGAVKETALKHELSDAGQDAATANERAAGLEKEAATARLETERLKSQLAWRAFSADQREILRTALAASPHPVTLAYVAGDPEALYLSRQFGDLLEAAGWPLRVEARTYFSTLVYGIYVVGPDGPATFELRNALTKANIVFAIAAVPVADIVSAPQGAADPAWPLLMIGSKLPPALGG